MVKPYLSIIIPAFNEAKRLPVVLIDVDRYLAELGYSSEIIVVNDGSTDKTEEIINRFRLLIPNLRRVSWEKNKGKGVAIRAGMRGARGNWRLVMDADGAIKISEFNKVIPFIKENYDIIIASRIKGSRIKNFPFWRRLAEFKLNIFARLMLPSRIRDFLIGFQCYSEAAAEEIFPRTRFINADLQIEALAIGERSGFKIKEIPVQAIHNIESRFKFVNYFIFAWSIIRLRRWLKDNGYEFSSRLKKS